MKQQPSKRKAKTPPRTKQSKPLQHDKYKSIFQNAIEGIFQSTLDGKLLTANPSFVKMLGYDSLAELKKHPLTDIFTNPSDRRLLTNSLSSAGFVHDFELKLKRKDGSEVFVSETSRLVKNRKGEVQYIEGMILDITERKRIEEQLRSA